MTVSLIISTYNSSEVLNVIIDAVSKQVKLPNEIIIAEDGNEINTHKVIDSWKNKISSKLIHVNQEDFGFRKALILNKAVNISKSDYIIQIDGDCIPNKYFIYDHIINAKKGCYLFGTRVHIKKTYVSKFLYCYQNNNKILTFSLFSPYIKKRFRIIRIPFFKYFYKQNNTISHKFRGCNTSFWRKDFISVNGYNNDFIGWGREDSDLMIRLHNNNIKGKRVKFCAIVYHLDHDQKDESHFSENDLIQKSSILNKKIKSDNGLLQLIQKTS
ncbi:MAG: glycosyl transferase [Flavobacteriaceae bacterium]|nr:glycosyl transferase [Flavobacteriaceae bacterium]|tara:strand:- start:2052 stop:2864 length:813 start_codon:yes stop_codon:yes gene_type:complete